MTRVGSVRNGPAVQWLGDIVVDGHTLDLWDGVTLKPLKAGDLPPPPTRERSRWTVVSRAPEYFFVDVYDASKTRVLSPPLRTAEASSDLAVDDEGRVWNLTTRLYVNAAPLACPSERGEEDAGRGGWWLTKPSYFLSPSDGFEECNLNHLELTVRAVRSAIVTTLGDGHLVFAPNDAYALIEPSDNKAGTRTTTDKVTFDASGAGQIKTIASHAVGCAAGPKAYAVATRTQLTVARACDDKVIAIVPLAEETYVVLLFSESGTLLLSKGASETATVYQLR
jgi:hypothetical protein